MPKKLKGGPFEIFQHPFCRRTSKNWRGTLWGKKFLKKSLTMPKKSEREDPLVSPGIVRFAEKHKNPFWFSSLSQIFQFSTIKYRRTFKNYFGQFVWIENKFTIIVKFHFMKRRLKTYPIAFVIDSYIQLVNYAYFKLTIEDNHLQSNKSMFQDLFRNSAVICRVNIHVHFLLQLGSDQRNCEQR